MCMTCIVTPDAASGHAEVVAVLLRRKGDASATNRQGATAADLAADPALKTTLEAAAVEAAKQQGNDVEKMGFDWASRICQSSIRC